MSLYIFDILVLYHYSSLCSTFFTPPLWLAFGSQVSIKAIYLQMFQCVSFWLHGFCGQWEGWVPVNQFNHTSWMTVFTPTDRCKSVRNAWVIEAFGGIFVLSIGFWIFCWYKGFRHGTESDLLLFLLVEKMRCGNNIFLRGMKTLEMRMKIA